MGSTRNRLGRLLPALLLACGMAHALYVRDMIRAYRVPNGSIKVDGKPEAVWRAVSAQPQGHSTLVLDRAGNIVLLQPDSVRNDPDPLKFFQPPKNDSVTLLAAYDDASLYFFFLIRESSRFDARGVCATADLWKADAAEVYVDPNVWSDTLYKAYFSADAGGLVYGTSAKSMQLDKPVLPEDARKYYRDRTKNNRFELRTAFPSGLQAVSAASPADSLILGVEMSLPIPSASAAAFAPGNSMFISWGYNRYPEAARAACGDDPIAYRWAKHYKTYLASDAQKPPGWRAGDSTHYDPQRSWDGWGRFYLSPNPVVDGSNCGYVDGNKWSLAEWLNECHPPATLAHPLKASRAGLIAPAEKTSRDGRGRAIAGGADMILFPDRPQ